MLYIIALLLSFRVYADDFNGIKVLSVHDGDTIKIELPNEPSVFRQMSVRLYGIDTPELHGSHACEKEKAIEAREFVLKAVKKAKVITLKDVKRDKYFRLLGDLYLDGNPIRESLLKAHLAYPYFGKTKKTINWCTY